jgi:hypothetical protein
MKNDIRSSCIPIPIPTDLYVSLLDLHNKSNAKYGPASMVTSILREYLDAARANPSSASDKAKEPASNWSNDWIMFGAPPALAEVTAPKGSNDPSKSQSNQWCIGCGYTPSDILSC